MKENQLLEMLNEQHILNCKISGQSWLNGVSKNGKGINFGRTMYMETAELIDSFPWKHWKNIDGDVDYLNVSIEMIDLWHFLMSATAKNAFNSLLEESNMKFEELTEDQVDIMWEEVCKISAKTILMVQESEQKHKGFSTFIKGKIDEAKLIDKEIIPFEIFIELALDLSINNGKDIKKEFDLVTALNAIFYVLVSEYVLINIYDLYNGKRILNVFRQDHGYKENTYVKDWNVENKITEDNMVMFSLINKGVKTCDLYDSLELIYNKQ